MRVNQLNCSAHELAGRWAQPEVHFPVPTEILFESRAAKIKGSRIQRRQRGFQNKSALAVIGKEISGSKGRERKEGKSTSSSQSRTEKELKHTEEILFLLFLLITQI